MKPFCEAVTATSTPHASVAKGTQPSELIASTMIEDLGLHAADRLADSLDVVRDAGRGLVMGNQDGVKVRVLR